jgi:transposase
MALRLEAALGTSAEFWLGMQTNYDLRQARKRPLGDAFKIQIISFERHWDGIAAYCKPEDKVSLGFVEGLNNKVRVLQRRTYGLRDEEYLRLKVLTCMLPKL